MTANRAPVGLKADPALSAIPKPAPLPLAAPAVPAVPCCVGCARACRAQAVWSENVTQPWSDKTKPGLRLG